MPVDLPKTVHHDSKPDDGKDIIISVTKDKPIYHVRPPPSQTPEDITRLVEEERRKHPEKTVFVKGDVRTTYGAVRG